MQVLSSFVSTKLTALNWNRSVPPCATSPISNPPQTEDGLFSPPTLVPCKDFSFLGTENSVEAFSCIRKPVCEQSPSLLPPESVSLGESPCFWLQPCCAPRQLPGLRISRLSGERAVVLDFHHAYKHRLTAAPITYFILSNLNKCCMYTGWVSF